MHINLCKEQVIISLITGMVSTSIIGRAKKFSKDYRKQYNKRSSDFSIGHLKLNDSSASKRAKKARAIRILTENGFDVAELMRAFKDKEEADKKQAVERRKLESEQRKRLNEEERVFYGTRENWYEAQLHGLCHEFEEEGHLNPWNEAEVWMVENADEMNRRCDEIFGEYP